MNRRSCRCVPCAPFLCIQQLNQSHDGPAISSYNPPIRAIALRYSSEMARLFFANGYSSSRSLHRYARVSTLVSPGYFRNNYNTHTYISVSALCCMSILPHTTSFQQFPHLLSLYGVYQIVPSYTRRGRFKEINLKHHEQHYRRVWYGGFGATQLNLHTRISRVHAQPPPSTGQGIPWCSRLVAGKRTANGTAPSARGSRPSPSRQRLQP